MIDDLSNCSRCSYLSFCDVSKINNCRLRLVQIKDNYYLCHDIFEGKGLTCDEKGVPACPLGYYKHENFCQVEDSHEDGQKCLEFMNAFRVDPASIPPKGGLPEGENNYPFIWSDELYNMALKHSMNMAEKDVLSHDKNVFDRVTSC